MLAYGPSAMAFRPEAAQAKPITIPSLKEWSGAAGSFTFNPACRIVAGPQAWGLLRTANSLSRDLHFLLGSRPAVVAENAQAGDIVFVLDASAWIGSEEGYRIEIGDRVEIRAAADAGVFYGTRTLLQLLKQNRILPRGSIRDGPDYRERGLMVDVGRKYFSLPWLKNQILDMGYAKLNLLHLHLSDDLGIRVASERHPDIVSAQFYTKAELREILALAAEQHVTIIPEIDVPGHTGWLRNSNPEFLLGSGDAGVHYMDITNPQALELVRDVLEEHIPLFPGPYWHMGADEYIGAADYSKYPQLEAYAKAKYGKSAIGIDAFLGFIGWVNGMVKSHGKVMRTWGDAYEYNSISPSSPVPIDKGIIQELWNAFEDPRAAIDAGFTIQNSSFHPTYYNLGSFQGDEVSLYQDWAPNKYMGGWERSGWGYPMSVDSLHPQLLGAKLSIWCDFPDSESEDQVAEGIYGRLRAIAQNSWGAPKLVASYGDFRSLMGVIGRAPGYGRDIPLGLKPVKRAFSTGNRHSFAYDLLGRRKVWTMGEAETRILPMPQK